MSEEKKIKDLEAENKALNQRLKNLEKGSKNSVGNGKPYPHKVVRVEDLKNTTSKPTKQEK